MKLLIKNGRLVDPANGRDGLFDILLDQGKVAAVEKRGGLSDSASDKTKIIDAQNLVVAPGFIDMHVHFREPGFEYKETILSGCQSAAAGGFTTVAVMPNTNPVNDSRAVTEFIVSTAKSRGIVNVLPIGAITHGLKGETLAEMGEMREAGAVAFSDDGKPVTNSELMRRAFEYSRIFDVPLIQHSEVTDLTHGGCMNEGVVSTRLGLKGMPTEAEDIMVFRDIALLCRTGGKLHVAHISSGQAIDLVRAAKKRGLPVTCEAAPHHFTLTDEAVDGFDTNTKMSPPLRDGGNVEAVKAGLRDGAIDIIATDHAPHHRTDKEVAYSEASFGIVGLETALFLTLRLVESGVLTLPQAIDKLTAAPARIFNLDKGSLAVGKAADVVIFDPELKYTVKAADFKSLSKNSPFDGWQAKGKVVYTLVNGKIVHSNN